MKKIEMILRPTNVEVVAEALVRIGVQGITLTRTMSLISGDEDE